LLKKKKTMKIRKHFISNSSTSSSVCDVCNEDFAGMDLSVYDVEHLRCENNYIICENSVVNPEKREELMDDDDYYNEVLSEFCPVCQMHVISQSEAIAFLMRKYFYTHESLAKEIKNRFKTYEDFNAFLLGK